MKHKSHLIFVLAGLLGVLGARAQTNLIASDNWSDGNYTNVPSGLSWFPLNTSSLYMATNSGVPSMVLSNSTSSSRSFFAYFTNNPVSVGVGQMITATLVFTPTNVNNGGATPQPTSRAFRFGMFNVANGVVVGGGNTEEFAGDGVGGYVSDFFFGSTFNAATNPIELYNRTNSVGTPLTDTTTNFLELSTAGPASFDTNANGGFLSGVTYTLQFSVAVYAGSNIVTTTITGAGLNSSNTISYSAGDTSGYLQTNFNSFQIRCNRNTDTAQDIDFTLFKVQTMPAPATVVSPIPIAVQKAGANIVLSWSNPVFNLQSKSTVTGSFSTVAGATSPYTNPITGTQQYFRLIH